MEETQWRTKSDIVEGFDIFGDDYFNQVPRYLPLPAFQSYLKQIIDFIKKIPKPTTLLDETIEAVIANFILLLMEIPDCMPVTTTTPVKQRKFAPENSFTWSSGTFNLFESPVKEGFSLNDTPNIVTTIQSFMKNHPNITSQYALLNYYLTELNAYVTKLGTLPTSQQLFTFNNEFDNELSNNKSLTAIQNLASSLPNPQFSNTLEGYQSYLGTYARFNFNNTANLVYYSFNTKYFPCPTDMSGFTLQLTKKTDPDFIKNINTYLGSIIPGSLPPLQPIPSLSIDPNFAFSIDLNTSQTGTIHSYLEYITLYYALVLYNNTGNDKSLLFPSIEANVVTTYIQYVNAVEFQKYRLYNTFMTPYELAVFNHLFFICLQQNISLSNVYCAAATNKNSGWNLTQAAPNIYINLSPQSIFGLITTFASEINVRVPYLTSIKGDYQSLAMDSTLVIPIMPTGNNSEILLHEYILNQFEPIEYKNKQYPHPITPTKQIHDYYIPAGLSTCESKYSSNQKEAQYYAKIIKNELYRLLMIPIILYIVYNFYYLFFFKDCFSSVREIDETGEYVYKHTCETGEKGGCFTPIFPDWETSYHSVENHRTDYIFEFIFKPVKFFYTFFNAFKAIFRNETGGIVIKDEVPYLFFMISFAFIYHIIHKYGAFFSKIVKQLMNFQIPTSGKLMAFSKVVLIFSFLSSFLKKVFGFSIMGGEDFSEESMLSKAMSMAKAAINKKERTWAEWLFIPAGTLMTVIKFICFIIYWVFKFIISFGMLTFSNFIFVIYFVWHFIFGMSSFTTPIQSVSSKIDLIYRVMYTKLCNNDESQIKYLIKSFFFFCIFLLVELLVLHSLYKGMKSYSTMSFPKMVNSKNNMAIKSYLVIIYGVLIAMVLLWCVYKIHVKMPQLTHSYKSSGDDKIDKTFTFDCRIKDVYEDRSKNDFFNIFMGSDKLNQLFVEEFSKKTMGIQKPSFISGIIKKMGDYGEKLNKNSGETKEKMDNIMGDITGKVSGLSNNISSNFSDMASELKTKLGSNFSELTSKIPNIK
jgi:hypothetical protein